MILTFGQIEPEIIYGDFLPKDGDNNLRKLIKESTEIMKTTGTSVDLMINKIDDIVNSMNSGTIGMNIAVKEMKSCVSKAVTGMNTDVIEMKSCVSNAVTGMNIAVTQMNASVTEMKSMVSVTIKLITEIIKKNL